MGDWRKRGGWLRRRGEHHGSELHFRDEYHTPKSHFWPVHVAIHLLRLAKKKKERGWNNH